ncbi:unnamed protein product [Microthlaspi erraticum]|uniref:Pentacotripeptide-repeat region of PRORP domain-containing protein n=1 Tax=Microthlaspi erraticum TaxID=1685480 RepID=A0A6D2I837_9BRAS|nr:unnamed protein product [Microthlaspi erraticum]CAA7023063.1 unnamed protein product [Microthlaspi erraticum]
MMFLIGRVTLGRRFSTAVARRAEDIMANPDCRPEDICMRVSYLGGVGDGNTAAKYARLAVFSRSEPEYTATTCQHIIGSMLQEKRHKDAYDLYDYFFKQHELTPNSQCCNYMIESRFQQGLVEEALDFHRSITPGMASGYPSKDTLRVLTKGLVHSGRLDQAEALLKARTTVDRFIFPDHVAFNNLIRGYLDLGNLDKANLVLHEFKRMLSSSIARSKSTYEFFNDNYPGYENSVTFLTATFMDYWFKQGKEVEAMECYNQSLLRANKLPVCPETGNALLKVLLRYGKKYHAWALYHQMFDQSGTDSNRRLQVGTVHIMVNECFDMGRCSEAIETYNKAGFSTGGYIITSCFQNGFLSEADSLFAFADSLAHGPASASFKPILHAYLKAGRIDDALESSNKMIDAALKEVSDLF